MAGIHLLDRLIGDDYPSFATDAEVHAFEQVPYADRIAVESTYEAISSGAACNPDAPAIQFLPNADPVDTPIVVTHRDFVARITQAANMFHALGVGRDDVVSFLLPLLPEAFITLFGAEAAGIANPVNPLLEPHQIAEILQAARTTVLVALGPLPGTNIWQKVERVRADLKHLKAIVKVCGPPDPANGVYSFGDLIKTQPSAHLVSGGKISGEQIAAYFHTRVGGYLNETHNRGAFIDGHWVNSGDLGRRDKEGFLWITGRAMDLLIRGGRNIDPAKPQLRW